MLGKMKLSYKDLEEPCKTVDKIKIAVCAGEKNNLVHFSYVGRGWYPRFKGISITTDDDKFHSVLRKVMIKDVDKEYEIDLDKVKEKYEELKILAVKYEVIREENSKKDAEILTLIKNLWQGVENIFISRCSSGGYDIKIYGVSEEKVRKVVEFVKTLNEKEEGE